MESSTRNLMVVYAIVTFLSVAGVALNIIPIYNIKARVETEMPEYISKALIKGFYIMAAYYFIIALVSLGAILKKKYSKILLVSLIILLLIAFVFRPVIFDFIVGEFPK